MNIPVLIEPHPPGFRATTGGPLDLSADGPTPEAALDALRSLVADRLKAGGQLRILTAEPGGQLRTLTAADVEAILAAAQRMRENPLFEEFEQAIEEYRREHNTVPEPD
jgi:hypothetical protein